MFSMLTLYPNPNCLLRWLLINNTDPAGELEWLIKVLQSAEDNKEKVTCSCSIAVTSNRI